MEELYIYVDEAGNPNMNSYNGNERFFEVGAAVLTHEVSQQVIDNALSELQKVNPNDLTNSDKKSIQKGYFHAKDDGPAAKSKLMDEVNKLVIEFYHYKYDKQLHHQLGLGTLKERDLHFRLIHLCSVIGLNYGVKKIHLIVAQRDKSFPHGSEQKWIDSFYEALRNALKETPALKTPFPEIEVTIVNGKNPGVQIADSLLWITQRKYRIDTPDERWYERLESKTSANVTTLNDPLSMNDFYLNSHLPLKKTGEIYYSITPSAIDAFERDTSSPNRFSDLLQWMEDIIVETYNAKNVEYLNPYLVKAVRLVESPKVLTIEEVKIICEAFLMVFDTTDIGEQLRNDHEQLKLALLAKRYASIILEGKENRWFTMSEAWGKKHPQFFQMRNLSNPTC